MSRILGSASKSVGALRSNDICVGALCDHLLLALVQSLDFTSQ